MHCGNYAIFARYIETTKRYAFLVIGNVRNFQSQQESVAVRAYSVDWLLPLLTKVISRPPIEEVANQLHASNIKMLSW